MARFVIADISDAKAVLQELHRVLPARPCLLAAVRPTERQLIINIANTVLASRKER